MLDYKCFLYLQANDEDTVTPLGDDKHEHVTSDCVRVSEEVPRSLSGPAPTQSHTSTDSTSEIGKYSC